TRIANGDQVANLQLRQRAIPSDDIAAFAYRSNDFVLMRWSVAQAHRLDAMERAIERRAHQLTHARVDHGKLADRVAHFEIDDARNERAGRRRDGAARLDDNRQARVADFTHERRRIVDGRGRRAAVV